MTTTDTRAEARKALAEYDNGPWYRTAATVETRVVEALRALLDEPVGCVPQGGCGSLSPMSDETAKAEPNESSAAKADAAPAKAPEKKAAVKRTPAKRTVRAAREGEALGAPVTGSDPFEDKAPPVGGAINTDDLDTSGYFADEDVPFTVSEGDVVVAVRLINQRPVVEVKQAGWVGDGQIYAAYQVSSLIKALQAVAKKVKKG